MDIERVLAELIAERDLIDQAIESLERMSPDRWKRARPGRPRVRELHNQPEGEGRAS